jgi:hypothetical protein
MSKPYFPTPTIAPFHRLHVYDSLMMNAQRWLLAHNYHRRRQNVHYQALNQPGIVCGLGVYLIDSPETTEARFRDQRWIEIQPGIAIDVEGNIIVVNPETDRSKRIAAKAPTIGTLTVYVVVSYVEPENPAYQHPPETLQEQFRFDQKTTPPTAHEIELCRIQLGPGTVQIEHPTNVLFPGINQLDFRHRVQAQARSLAVVTAAQVELPYLSKPQEQTCENLASLMASVRVLYPPLQGNPEVGRVGLEADSTVMAYDLLYLTSSQLMQSSTTQLETLSQYLTTGGVMLIEATSNDSEISSTINCITYQLEVSLQSWQTLEKDHPLRSQPFLFAALPTLNQEPIQMWTGGGIVFVAGELSSTWGVDELYSRPRNEIRTAQEFGINLLQFAHQRRHMTQLLH